MAPYKMSFVMVFTDGGKSFLVTTMDPSVPVCAGKVKNGRAVICQSNQHYKKLKGKQRGLLFYPTYIISKLASARHILSSKVDKSDPGRLPHTDNLI